MSKAAATFAVLVAALTAAPSATAAMCIRWEVATSARPGERVVVAFRTIAPLVNREWMPYIVRDYPFRVAVASPNGDVRPIAVAPRAKDPEVWEGSFTPRVEGRWQVAIANFEESFSASTVPSEDDCYRRLPMTVAAADGVAIWGWLVLGLGLAVAGGLGWVTWRRVMSSRAASGNGLWRRVRRSFVVTPWQTRR